MATIVDSVKVQSASANNVTIPALTGRATGDVVIVTVHANTQATLADNNSGQVYTEDLADYKPNTSSGHVVSVFRRVIQDGDTTTPNFTCSATGRISAIAVCFRGVHADIYDVAPSTTNADNLDSPPGSSDATAPDITTTTNNAIHCACAFIDASIDDFDAWPSGYTVHESVDNNQGQTFATKVISPAGATGVQTFEHNGSGTAFIGLSFAIKDSGVSTSVKDIISGFIPFAR